MKTSKLVLYFIILIPVITSSISFASDNIVNKNINPCLSIGVKKSIVFLGYINPKKEAAYTGTAFLIQYDRLYYLVTAKHILEEFKQKFNSDNNLSYFLNEKDGKSSYGLFSEYRQKYNVAWVTSPNTDVAIIPFPIGKNYDVRTIPDDAFLTSDNLFELQDVFYLSYQPGIESQEKVTPIARHGMVSILNEDNTFYLDAFAFPGNSGSPVFLRPGGVILTPGGLYSNDPLSCSFVGIIGEYLTYQEVAISTQSKRPRILFEENTGLARVWPVQSLKNIMSSSEFILQHKNIKERLLNKK